MSLFKNKPTEKRTTSLQGTSDPFPMCPLFRGFTVVLEYTIFLVSKMKMTTVAYLEY